MTVLAGPATLLDIVGARGEGVLEMTRRLGLGGATVNSTNAEAAEALATYMAGLGIDANLAAAVAAKADAEAAATAAAAYANVTFATIAAAKAITFSPALVGLVINVACYATEGDGGGGRFEIVEELPEDADDGIYFETGDPDYFLIRRFDDCVRGQFYRLTSDVADRTQNTDRLIAALNAATALGLPYKHRGGQRTPLDYEVTIPTGAIIDKQGGVWDFTEADGPFDNYVNVKSEGSFTDLAALSGNVSKGASLLPFAATPDCEVGDILFISSTAVWNSARAYYNKGEAVQVAWVDGNNVYLSTTLRDSYTSATTSVGKLNQNNLKISDLHVIGDDLGGNSAVILSHLGPEASLIRPQAHTPNGAQSLYITRACGPSIVDPYITRLGDTTGSTYALIFGNSQGVRVTGGRCVSIWHACAIGGDNLPYNIVNRDIVIDGTELRHDPSSPHAVAAADFHGNCEDCAYINIPRMDGCNIGGRRNRIGGATNIKAGNAWGLTEIAVLFSEILSLDHLVESTVSIEGKGYSSHSYGLAFDADTPNGGLTDVIDGGTLRFYADVQWSFIGGGSTTQYYFRLVNNTSTANNLAVDLSEASFRCVANDGTLAGGINITGASTLPINDIVLPKKRSTFFCDVRYFRALDAANVRVDCDGLGTTPNLIVATTASAAKVIFDGAMGFGGSAEFIKVINGSGISAVVSALGVKVKSSGGYTELLDVDSAGLMNSGLGDWQGLGATLANLNTVYHTPGVNDGSISHSTVSSFKTSTYS